VVHTKREGALRFGLPGSHFLFLLFPFLFPLPSVPNKATGDRASVAGSAAAASSSSSARRSSHLQLAAKPHSSLYLTALQHQHTAAAPTVT